MKLPKPLPAWTLLFLLPCLLAHARPRARDLGIPFEGKPGPKNAITDVPGVEVGLETLIHGDGKLVRGKGPVRTGVTAIFPRGKAKDASVPAAWFSLNGNGEMTGTAWIDENGKLEGPIVLTNTHSVGVARDAVVAWGVQHFPKSDRFSLPVVAETWDGLLNDIDGFHVTQASVFSALDKASDGPVAEGNVGGGTGMVLYRFKGGTGTSSREVKIDSKDYRIGALVQANFGQRADLRVAGVPVGLELTGNLPVEKNKPRDGSIIVVMATDAPLLPHQLKKLARRVSMGLGAAGSIARNSSGDLFLVFSTTEVKTDAKSLEVWHAVPSEKLDPLFEATTQVTQEAIVNALVAAETMVGINGNTVYAISHEELKSVLRKFHRLR